MIITDSDKIRFLQYVDIGEEHECWEWTGSFLEKGYGSFHCDKRSRRAHRISWQMEHGEIPFDMWVLHTCHNRACVNPEHLYLGDALANAADRDEAGRGWQGRKHTQESINKMRKQI